MSVFGPHKQYCKFRLFIIIDAFFGFSDSADVVTPVKVEQLGTNYTAGTVMLSWQPPAKSNGMIVTYTVRYKRMDLEHSTGTDLCITQSSFNNKSLDYILKSLENGNYSFSVMATSFAGQGPWSTPTIALIDVSVIAEIYHIYV